MDYKAISPETIGLLYQSHASIRSSGLNNSLVALAELRVSQLNGCAYCCRFHTAELRAMGIAQELLDVLPGWRHATGFTEKQQLVLEWAEAVTLLQPAISPLQKQLSAHFTTTELVNLTAGISLMNALNRLRLTLGDKA